MKMYIINGYLKGNVDKYISHVKTQTFIVSPEGMYVTEYKKIYKLIIDEEYEIEEKKIGKIYVNIDKSKTRKIGHSKIPFEYKELEYEEKVYNINHCIDLVCISNKIYYYEYEKEDDIDSIIKNIHELFDVNIIL
jgi:hypothetical protein